MSLGTTITEAMNLFSALVRGGATRQEAARGLETLLRDIWPFTREWKVLCASCDDYGLQMADCRGDATCGRSKQHLPHTYGSPCWCDKGARFREKAKRETDYLDEVGKTQKPRGFTRAGR